MPKCQANTKMSGKCQNVNSTKVVFVEYITFSYHFYLRLQINPRMGANTFCVYLNLTMD